MSESAFPINSESLTIPTATAKEIGARYADDYQSGKPYHHICIDNFLPMDVIEKVRADIASLPEADLAFDNAEEKLKSQYNPDRLPSYSRHLFQAFNSRPFLLFLEEMTGIKKLIPDPYFMGAGIHKTLNGGHLNIHADFNLHSHMNVERRLNVLIYLNPPWKEEWGGSFEIWDNDMTRKVAGFTPTENRMVCFSTGSNTFHGNPEPVNHPEGLPRQSIALYYYTATWDDTRVSHGTIFKPRPGSNDASDKRDRRRRLLHDVLPPVLHRRIAPRLRRLGF
ncbi:proline hydroxylase [Ruegeria sp. ANG-R]|uniref:2OG-Fe(II) oxygenase n=1 Tax=Ruegeria sp. ANG-R TaxID=1577903 RepID=UPI00057E756B|nr:2OG-Fe(II) oxygenase [Ruegeria sp. ANG-R]KIC40588.1 proline hydroxylase [Ruegeria sp. ANG-R]